MLNRRRSTVRVLDVESESSSSSNGNVLPRAGTVRFKPRPPPPAAAGTDAMLPRLQTFAPLVAVRTSRSNRAAAAAAPSEFGVASFSSSSSARSGQSAAVAPIGAELTEAFLPKRLVARDGADADSDGRLTARTKSGTFRSTAAAIAAVAVDDAVTRNAREIQAERKKAAERHKLLESCVPVSLPSMYSIPAAASASTSAGASSSMSVLVNQTLCRMGGLALAAGGGGSGAADAAASSSSSSSSWLHLVFARVPTVECVPSNYELYSRACVDNGVPVLSAELRASLSATPGRYNHRVLSFHNDAAFGCSLANIRSVLPLIHHNRHNFEELLLQCSSLTNEGLGLILGALTTRELAPATRDDLAMALHDGARLTRLTECGGRYHDFTVSSSANKASGSASSSPSPPRGVFASASQRTAGGVRFGAAHVVTSGSQLHENDSVASPQAGGLQEQLKMERLRDAVQKNIINLGAVKLRRINLSCNLALGGPAMTRTLVEFLAKHPNVTFVNTQQTAFDQEAVRRAVFESTKRTGALDRGSSEEPDMFGYSPSGADFMSASTRRRSSVSSVIGGKGGGSEHDAAPSPVSLRRGSSSLSFRVPAGENSSGGLQRQPSASVFYSSARRSMQNALAQSSASAAAGSASMSKSMVFVGDADVATPAAKTAGVSLAALRQEQQQLQQAMSRRMMRASSASAYSPRRGGAAAAAVAPAAAGLTKEQFDKCVAHFRSVMNPHSGLIELPRIAARNTCCC